LLLLNLTAKSAKDAKILDSVTHRDFNEDQIAHQIIGAAIEVHRAFGPGLLESLYEAALCKELTLRNISFERQACLNVDYKGTDLGLGYRLDLLVAGLVIVEIKSVEKLLPIHDAQLLTYLKLADKRLGLIINFNEMLLKNGVKRLVLRNNLGVLGALGGIKNG
jgi:GxxExxY protein